MLFTRRITIKPDARTFDAPLRAFASADEQLPVDAKFNGESIALPLRPDEGTFIQRVRVGGGFSRLSMAAARRRGPFLHC